MSRCHAWNVEGVVAGANGKHQRIVGQCVRPFGGLWGLLAHAAAHRVIVPYNFYRLVRGVDATTLQRNQEHVRIL